MKHATMKTFSRRSFPFLGILKGLQSEKNDLDHFVNTAWLFAYSIFYNNQVFSVTEKEETKQYIRDWMAKEKDNGNVLLAFCQRAMFARQYYKDQPSDYFGLPSIWFDTQNDEGFWAITEEWYDDLKFIRSSRPNHLKELKAIAEAVMEFSEEPSHKNFQYWRDYFIDWGEPVLLNRFSVFCANCKLNIH